MKKKNSKFSVKQDHIRTYSKQLNKIASNVNKIIIAHSNNVDAMISALNKYANTLDPWAKSQALKMLKEIDKQKSQAWKELSLEIKKELTLPTNIARMQPLIDEQVKLIKSLPIEAASKAQYISITAYAEGKRPESIIKDLLELGQMTENRARLIARTEVAKAASTLTQARSELVGATHYIWRTSKDSDVRDSHKVMNGKVIAWAEPPEVDPGQFYHAGQFPNCRCFPIPILPDEHD